MLDRLSKSGDKGGDTVGAIKLIISFITIGLMGWSMQRTHPEEWQSDEMWKFEIPAAILAAGWIMHDGW
jgi:hypothetical protein